MSPRILTRNGLISPSQYLCPHLNITPKRITRPVPPTFHDFTFHVPRFLNLDYQRRVLRHNLPPNAQSQWRQTGREEHRILIG